MIDAAFLDRALDVARQAAQAAAAVIDGYYQGAYHAELKPDATPVTQADIEAEQAIRQVLREAFPDHAIHGEEQGRDGEGDFLWLVDPLARTLEAFALREGRWTVVGLFQEQDIVSVEPFQDIALELGALWMEPAED